MLLYADPPWSYRDKCSLGRRIEEKYPTLSLEEIKQYPIPISPTAILCLWAVSPQLPEALDVIRAWGFTYKAILVWDKLRIGMGSWWRVQHEFLLLAIKGNVSAPTIRPSSVLRCRRGRHSEKPFEVREMLAKMFPATKKIELFARTGWEGWESHGNEVQKMLWQR